MFKMTEYPMFFIYLVLFFFCVSADRDNRGTPAQEQCKIGRCAKHCSCSHYKPRNCYEILQNGCDDDGVYRIFPVGYRRGLEVFCDQTTDGGGWQLFQRRFNGSLQFNKKWTDYKYGFGDVAGEFWLGNEHVYNILKQEHSHATLRADVVDTENNTMFAEYRVFSISSEAHSYKIELGGFVGDSGNSMRPLVNHLFSTVDRDHTSHHLPSLIGGAGWWLAYASEYTAFAILNGPFAHTSNMPEDQWMRWKDSGPYLRKTEMKFR